MASTNRFKVKEKGGEWLIFDTLSPVKRYIGVVTLVKHANQLQKMALRWVDKLKVATEENATLKAQLSTLQEAHDTTVTHMAQENARLKKEMEAWVAMSVSPKEYDDMLHKKDAHIVHLMKQLQEMGEEKGAEIDELKRQLKSARALIADSEKAVF